MFRIIDRFENDHPEAVDCRVQGMKLFKKSMCMLV